MAFVAFRPFFLFLPSLVSCLFVYDLVAQHGESGSKPQRIIVPAVVAQRNLGIGYVSWHLGTLAGLEDGEITTDWAGSEG